jgi:hypothetical protein
MRTARVTLLAIVLAMAGASGTAQAQGTVTTPRERASLSDPAAAMPMMSPPVASVLPSSRSVMVGTPATAFATMMNTGGGMATACGMTMTGNLPIGMPNTPMDMSMGGSQTFMFAFTPMAPMDPTDMVMDFSCTNTGSADVHHGLNTFFILASTTPVPDMVTVAATLGNDGIVNVPGADGMGAFAVATVNMGIGGTITASVWAASSACPANARRTKPAR